MYQNEETVASNGGSFPETMTTELDRRPKFKIRGDPAEIKLPYCTPNENLKEV